MSDNESDENQSKLQKRHSVKDTRNVFCDYSQRSSIHGVRYLGEENRHWIEKSWWLISFGISIFVCCTLIYQIYVRWLYSPAIINFSNEATPISDIPFPTITICSSFELKRDALNYSYIHDQLESEDFANANLSEEEIQRLYTVSNYCIPPRYFGEYIKQRKVQIDGNILPRLQDIMSDLYFTPFCLLSAGTVVRCADIFTTTLTDGGLCHTFNYLDSAQIYHENKLADDFPRLKPFRPIVYSQEMNLSYPYRMQNGGIGLKLQASVEKNVGSVMNTRGCARIDKTVKLHVHSGDEVPQLSKHFYHIPFQHDMHLTIKPNIIKTDESLIKNYKKDQRKCIADHENELVFFKKYSQSNCYLDVLVLQTIKKCGCVMPWMPRFNDTKVCSLWEDFVICVGEVQRSTENINLQNKCLPSCDSITYDAEISMSKTESDAKDENNSATFKLVVTLKNEQYYSLRRSELYTRNDFIAGCGGILGLFMGFSFLSVIEIIYSVTLRLYFDSRRCKFRREAAKMEHLCIKNEDEQVENGGQESL